MSNTITIKDPNGNIVCSVENMGAVKSEEGSGGAMEKLAMGVSSAKEKIDANYAKKILKKLDPNYVNGLRKELKQIIEDENRMINEIALDVESRAMKNQDIKSNCKDISINYYENNHDGKVDEKEANKYLNKRIIDLVNTIKKPKEIDYNSELIGIYFADVSDDWWDETEDAMYDLKKYLTTFANNKKYSNKYIDHVNVSFHDADADEGDCWFAFDITFTPNKEEMDKLLKPIVDAINS